MSMVSSRPGYSILGDDYPNSTDYDFGNQSSTMEPMPYYTYTPPYVPPAVLAAKVVSVALIILITVVGNSIVITIILSNKHMRTTTYFYLMNLAVADIIIALISEWTWLANHLMQRWIFGAAMCKISALLQGVSIHVSILTLTVVAGDRYFAILHPLKSRVIKRNAGLVIGIVWLIAFLINIPMLLNMKHTTHTWDDGQVISWCYEYWEGEDRRHQELIRAVYTTLLFVGVYVLPLFLMSVTYIRIGCTLKSRSTHGPGVKVEGKVSTQERSKRKVIKMLVVVVSIFALCWLPFHILNLIQDWSPDIEADGIPKELWFICTWLAYANSAMNPFVYCGFNENFRRGFRDAFTGRWCAGKKRQVKPNKSVCSSQVTDGTVVESTSML
ncbi:neuropeptide FF receptor 2-like [Patiria miniata]|uniref:G-protein coupled receptors family 1 profile domain-containing protein n=1 Tax=Patiria miniata TaxID=46514 RepID=A0A914A919_PATMI|nr:neuropeptide FF receptor 2-like [Patiria miniata]XP_038060337.1 neuropeptide FF receptor 2-like [Patiria miniata]XP_038060338.1 neuropeptide FF receptor 2-like [Patiria miniata]